MTCFFRCFGVSVSEVMKPQYFQRVTEPYRGQGDKPPGNRRFYLLARYPGRLHRPCLCGARRPRQAFLELRSLSSGPLSSRNFRFASTSHRWFPMRRFHIVAGFAVDARSWTLLRPSERIRTYIISSFSSLVKSFVTVSPALRWARILATLVPVAMYAAATLSTV